MDFLLFPLPLIRLKRQRLPACQLVQGDAKIVGEDAQLTQGRFPFPAFIAAIRHRRHTTLNCHDFLAPLKPLSTNF